MNNSQRLVRTICLLACVVGWMDRAGATSPAPAFVNYQGVLRSASGAPLTGSYDMIFRFYDVPAGGTLILQDRHTDLDVGSVTVTGALFNVQLGTGELRDALNNLAAPGAFLALFRERSDVYLEIQVESEILNPRTRIASAPYSLAGPRGVVYTRWGKESCPAGASLVYNGFAAAGIFNATGPSSQLCLASVPTWDQFSDADNAGGRLFGNEYQTSGSGIASLVAVSDEDAPCAVCLQPDADVVFMYPGRGYNSAAPTSSSCPAGWRTEYQGYLMTARNATREVICMDRSPDTIVGGGASTDGALWYMTEGACGTLPCPPYVNNREITCSVCTR